MLWNQLNPLAWFLKVGLPILAYGAVAIIVLWVIRLIARKVYDSTYPVWDSKEERVDIFAFREERHVSGDFLSIKTKAYYSWRAEDKEGNLYKHDHLPDECTVREMPIEQAYVIIVKYKGYRNHLANWLLSPKEVWVYEIYLPHGTLTGRTRAAPNV